MDFAIQCFNLGGSINFFIVLLKRYYDAKIYYNNSFKIFNLKSLHLKTILGLLFCSIPEKLLLLLENIYTVLLF